MPWLGLGIAGVIAFIGGAAIGIWRSHESDQQREIEALQSELQEVAQWVDTVS